ncbi:MAG: nuclear transport factor 2 family protein [Gammaproteobacteria bacterium]|nr:nuclear transport factor 2 family protein [Gammaproteobacteria bacterium]
MNRKLLVLMLATLLGSAALADDADDVMAFIERYAQLESDLDTQENLIRADRVQIAPTRWTNNAAYMEWQKRERAHREAVSGAAADWLVQIESMIRVYGDTAVASFIRRQMIMPPNAAPIFADPLWQTVVLVREKGEWGIAHTHVSPVGSWN